LAEKDDKTKLIAENEESLPVLNDIKLAENIKSKLKQGSNFVDM
jgi:hypothetical protein